MLMSPNIRTKRPVLACFVGAAASACRRWCALKLIRGWKGLTLPRLCTCCNQPSAIKPISFTKKSDCRKQLRHASYSSTTRTVVDITFTEPIICIVKEYRVLFLCFMSTIPRDCTDILVVTKSQE